MAKTTTEAEFKATAKVLAIFTLLLLSFCDHRDEQGDLHDAIIDYTRSLSDG